MKQVIATRADQSLSSFTLSSDATTPVNSDHELLVRSHAASLNPIDWKIAAGYLGQHGPPFPWAPGFDCAGVVVQVGHKVNEALTAAGRKTSFKVGDRIYVDRAKGMATLSEFVAVNPLHAAHAPSNLTLTEAAAVPLVSLTAIQAFVDHGALSLNPAAGAERPRILVTSGSAATGIVAIQLAKIIGAHVITLCSTRNLEFVKKLGADEVVDYTTNPDWSTAIPPHSIDLVYDNIGGADQFEKSVKVLKPTGRFVTIGNVKAPAAADAANLPSFKFFLTDSTRGDQLELFTPWIEAGKIKVFLDKVFPLEQTTEAFQYLQKGKSVGKVVVEVIPAK